jgi:hypothetical protein
VSGSPGRGRVLWMLAGTAALVGGTLLGWSADLLDAVATPPPLLRATLVGLTVVAGLWCLRAAVERIEAGRTAPGAELATDGLVAMVRGVRLVFLAVAAFSAAAGWLLGHPLPLVVALVIAGVDILETTFLLIVVSFRHDR